MRADELIAYISGGCRRSVAELARGDVGLFDKHLYQTRLDCAKKHLAWRSLKMPAKPTKQKPVTPRRRATVAQVSISSSCYPMRRHNHPTTLAR
jgi:hypothetical protein